MGVAIILIMASHTLGGYASYGIIGVEWFLLLSAIGQWHSLEKDSNVYRYYKKRLLRILPTYLIVSIPFLLIKYPSLSFSEFFLRITGIYFFISGNKLFWFVYLIIICYLIAPFYILFVKANRYSIIVPFVLSVITLIASFYFPRTEILFSRIPVFLLGMNLAKIVYDDVIICDKNRVELCHISSIVALFLLLVVYLNNIGLGAVRFVYFYCAIPSLFFVLNTIKRFSFINKPLSFLGEITYEIYLIHQPIILSICKKFPLPKAAIIVLSYFIAILGAFLLHLVLKRIKGLLNI